MYTKIGRIIGKKEAQAFYDTIRAVHDNLQVCELAMTFKNPAISSVIRVSWERAAPGRGDWESLSVTYEHKHRNDMEDELFDDHHQFAEAYELKAV